MKTAALFLTAIFAATGAARAATIETMSAELEKAGFTVQTGGQQHLPPKPPQVHPTHPTHPTHPVQPPQVHPTHPVYPPQVHPTHPTHPVYPPQVYPVPGYPVQPGHPQYPPVYPPVNPGHPQYPGYPPQYPPQYPPVYPPVNPNPGYPPYYPPAPQTQQFRFESGNFVFASDARQSMENAAVALQRAGYALLEKRSNYTTYTLVFLAPSHLQVEKYVSGNFVFASDAKKAADDFVRAMELQGKVVLEKNVSGTSFVVSYLGYGNAGYMQNQTYESGRFVFASDASRSLNEALAALQGVNAVILEKRLIGNAYTIVFQAPFRVEFQKYVSGNYTFASDAQRAAAETASALAAQGLKILEKNVAGTQFTITYFRPGYYY